MSVEKSRMRHEVRMVTPEWAKAVLETAPPNVRKLIPQSVEKFARDMLAGRWVLHHQGIAFDEHGSFFDGYNRLSAVVKANVSVPMLVSYGVPDEGKSETDGQTVRALGAAIGCTAREASLARVIEQLPHGPIRVWTRKELAAKKDKHKDAITFAVECCSGIRVAVAALAARAYYHTPENKQARLAGFFAILRNRKGKLEELSDADSAAGEYRKKLRSMKTYTGQQADSLIYCFGQTALSAFMKDTPMAKFCRTDEDIFPLPE